MAPTAALSSSPAELHAHAICNAVMRGVVAAGVVTDANMTAAIAIMRAEVKALLFGPGYADERAAVLARSVNEAYVVASVVASCVLKIREARAV